MRPIDADALKYTQAYESCGIWQYKAVNIVYETDIEAAPTIDAVPVVRCKDCEHNYSKKHNKRYNHEDIVCDYFETDGRS